MPDVQPLATSLMPQYEAPADRMLRLGELGYVNTQNQLNQQLYAQRDRDAANQQANSDALAAALNPPTLTPDQVTAAGGSQGETLGTLGNGRPTMMTPPDGVPPAIPPQAPGPPQQPAQPMPPPDTPDAQVSRYVRNAAAARIPVAQINATVAAMQNSYKAQNDAVQLAQTRRAAQDQDTWDGAYQDNPGDPDAALKEAVANGLSADKATAVQTGITAQKTAVAKLNGDDLDSTGKSAAMLAASLKGFQGLSRLDQMNQWGDLTKSMSASGALTPADMAHWPAAAPDAAGLQSLINAHLTLKGLTDQETAAREAATQQETVRHNQATEEEAATPKTAAELALVANDPKATDAQKTQAKGALKDMAAQAQASRSVTTNNIGAPVAPLGAQPAPGQAPLHGMAFLGTLRPADAARVQAIADGREPAPSTGGSAARVNGPILAGVEQYDPSWSAQRGQMRRAFTTGADGRNIGNLNTAAVHLAQLADAGAAMQNGSYFVPGNQLYNRVATMLGGSAPTTFEALKTVVAGEMASAMKGNATDPEIASFNASVKSSSSPEQLAGVIQKAFMPALAAKLRTYDERYHAQSTADDPWTPVLPSARAAFSRYGIDPTAPMGAGDSVAPIRLKNGTTLTPHDAAAAAAFRRDHPELIQ